ASASTDCMAEHRAASAIEAPVASSDGWRDSPTIETRSGHARQNASRANLKRCHPFGYPVNFLPHSAARRSDAPRALQCTWAGHSSTPVRDLHHLLFLCLLGKRGDHLMMRKHLWGICALATACLGTFGTASAFAPEETSATFSVQLPFSDGEFLAYGAQAADFVPPHVERQLEANLGGNWTVYAWNRQSNSPHIVYGSGVDVAPPFSDDSSVESAARFVLEQNSTALHVNPENLRLDVVQGGMGKIAAHFIQTYEGLDVIGGRAHVTFTDQGRVFVMSSDYYGIEGLDVTPTLSVAQAENIAMSDLVSFSQRNISSRPDEASKLYVLPVPTAVDQVEFRLVYRVTVETDGRTGAWITDVDAKTGQILSRQNDVHFINYLGTTQGEVQNGTYCNGSAIVPLGWMNVVINPVGTATSNPAGAWTLTNGDSTPRNAVTRFY